MGELNTLLNQLEIVRDEITTLLEMADDTTDDVVANFFAWAKDLQVEVKDEQHKM